MGIGEHGSKHHLYFVFSNGPSESPAPLAGSRTLTFKAEGCGYLNTRVASETGGIVKQNQTYYVALGSSAITFLQV